MATTHAIEVRILGLIEDGVNFYVLIHCPDTV